MRKAYYGTAALFIIFSLFFIYTHIPIGGFERQGDEGFYLFFSRLIYNNGIEHYPAFFRGHIENKINWICPTPLRIGYFSMTFFLFKIFGPGFNTLAGLSFFSHILCVLISYFFAKRFFGNETAVLFATLLSFSPLAMALAKRALTDSFANLFMVLSVWLFLVLLTEKKTYQFVLFALCYTYSILIREQSILLLCFFSLYFLIYRYAYKKDIPIVYLFAVISMPVLAVFSIWLFSAGGLGILINEIKIMRGIPAVNEYVLLLCRGPWFRYILDFLLISPVVAILAMAFAIYSLIERGILKDYKVAYFLILFVVMYAAFSSFNYNKNVRYVMGLDMAMRLFVVLILREMFKRFKRYAFDLTFFVILLLCLIDFLNFTHLFCLHNIYDPVSLELLKAWRFIN